MVLQDYYNTLQSSRCIYRKFTHDDIESWMLFFQNNPNLKFLGIDLNRTNYELSKAWIDTQIGRYDQNEFGQLAMISKETGELIGSRGCSFIKIEGEVFLQSMGSIMPSYWKRGFGSESANCLFEYIYSNNITDKIISICHINNLVSQKYLEKLGFEKQNMLTMDTRLVIVYALTKTKWKISKA